MYDVVCRPGLFAWDGVIVQIANIISSSTTRLSHFPSKSEEFLRPVCSRSAADVACWACAFQNELQGRCMSPEALHALLAQMKRDEGGVRPCDPLCTSTIRLLLKSVAMRPALYHGHGHHRPSARIDSIPHSGVTSSLPNDGRIANTNASAFPYENGR